MNLDDLSLEFQTVHWHGHYFSAACPFDDHRHPAPMLVYEDSAYCKACDRKYTHQQVLDKLQGATVHSTVLTIPNTPPWGKWLSQFRSYSGIAATAHDYILSFAYARKHYASRGISFETIKKCKLGWLEHFLIFPVMDEDGQVVDMVARSTQEKAYFTRPRLTRDEPTHIYCPDWDRLNTANKYYLPFGMFDVLSMEEIGLPALTGISGKQVNPEMLPSSKVALICCDYNEDISANRLVQSLGWKGKRLKVTYPDDTKDPNDVLVKYGKDKLKEMIT